MRSATVELSVCKSPSAQRVLDEADGLLATAPQGAKCEAGRRGWLRAMAVCGGVATAVSSKQQFHQ